MSYLLLKASERWPGESDLQITAEPYETLEAAVAEMVDFNHGCGAGALIVQGSLVTIPPEMLKQARDNYDAWMRGEIERRERENYERLKEKYG